MEDGKYGIDGMDMDIKVNDLMLKFPASARYYQMVALTF